MIPGFTIDGVLPPYQGSGPGQSAALMSPYEVTAFDVASRFGSSSKRQEILKGWLEHRKALRNIGIVRGFQWLDGSFLEDKDPNDLDLVSLIYRPTASENEPAWQRLLGENWNLFNRSHVKASFNLDSFFLDMNGDQETLVSTSRYLLQLFSHQRSTFIWKGMLQVRLEDPHDDSLALSSLLMTPLKGQR